MYSGQRLASLGPVVVGVAKRRVPLHSRHGPDMILMLAGDGRPFTEFIGHTAKLPWPTR